MNQLSDNIPYHQRVFNTIWDKVNAIKWWQLIEAVSDELLFHQVKFPDMAKDGVMIIDDTAIEKFGIHFGIHMENASEIRISSGMIWITHSKSNRIFYLADDKGNPSIKKRASDFISFPTGQMKPLYRKNVRYHNIGRCYLLRYGWVYATVVYDTKRNPEAFLLVTNNLQASGWIIESYYRRWGIETFIRDAKQSLGLPNFHTRDFNGITAHLCVCILNYLVLSWLRYS